MRHVPELRVNLLQVGHCTGPEALTRRGGAWKKMRFPAGIAVIEHPTQGTVLFDSGYGDAFWRATHGLPERLYRWITPVHLRAEERLPIQLAMLGLPNPRWAILSHFHADHVAGLFDLTQMPMIFASADAVAGLAKGRIATLRAGCPTRLREGIAAQPVRHFETCTPVDLGDFGLAEFGTGRDIFSDNSMIAVPLPGHGVGQYGLFIPGGSIFLVADAIWGLRNLRDDCPPPDTTLRRLGDRAAYLDTFAKLRRFHMAHPSIRIVASHCAQAYQPNKPQVPL